MRSTNIGRTLLSGLSAALLFGVAVPAHAQYYDFRVLSQAYGGSGSISWQHMNKSSDSDEKTLGSPGMGDGTGEGDWDASGTRNVGVGIYLGRIKQYSDSAKTIVTNTREFYTFCIDPVHATDFLKHDTTLLNVIPDYATGAMYLRGSGADDAARAADRLVRAGALAYLANTYLSDAALGATTSARAQKAMEIQMAAWEIVVDGFENPKVNGDLGHGAGLADDFKGSATAESGFAARVAALVAEAYDGAVLGGGNADWINVTDEGTGKYQDWIAEGGTTFVPEPAFYQMAALLGLGGLGMLRLRKSRHKA